MKMNLILDVGCLALMTSVIMDTYLWITTGYQIPCWTMAVMSAGTIMMIQVIKRLIKNELV